MTNFSSKRSILLLFVQWTLIIGCCGISVFMPKPVWAGETKTTRVSPQLRGQRETQQGQGNLSSIHPSDSAQTDSATDSGLQVKDGDANATASSVLSMGIYDRAAMTFRSMVSQVLWVAVPIAAFALAFHFLETFVLQRLVHRFGWNAALWTGWIGTPIHESSHAILCVVFQHKIEKMALFEPDLEERRLGYVRHTYTKGKIWQEIGNFFIGLAPLAGGTLALLLLSWLLYPQLVDPFFNPSNQNIQAVSEDSTYKKDSISAQPNNTNPGNPAKQTNNPAKVKDPWIGFGDLTYGVGLGFQSLFSFSNLISWRFWLFLYLVTCVSVHMAPSASDYQGAKNGGWILLGIWLAAHLVHGLLGMSMEAWGWFFWPYWLQAIGTLVVASGLGTVVVVMVFLVTEIWDLFFDRSKLA